MRINQVARELEVENREILEFLESLGISGKTHSSSLDGALLDRVREHFGGRGAIAVEEPPAAEPKREIAPGKSVSSPAPAKPQPVAAPQAAQAAPAAAPAAPAAEPPKPRQAPTVEDVRQALQRSMQTRAKASTAGEDTVRSALQSQAASAAAAKRADMRARSDQSAARQGTSRFRERLTEKAQTATREALRKRISQRLGSKSVLLRPLAEAEVPPVVTPPVEPEVEAAARGRAEAGAVAEPPSAEAPTQEPKLTPEEMALRMIGGTAPPVPERKAEDSFIPAEVEEQVVEQKNVEPEIGRIDVLKLFGQPETTKPVQPPKPIPHPMRTHRPGRSRKSIRRQRRAKIAAQEEADLQREERERTTLRVHEATTVADIAHGLQIPPSELIGKLFSFGIMATINQRLDLDTIQVLADEYGFTVEETSLIDEGLDLQLEEEVDDEASLVARAPVVTVMGHVDHGKTKLLDAIRSTNVVDTESGGITQHIGAYRVRLPAGEITFLDTPGHEAFTSMRARGAQVTDIVVLVVAADDGVMPQTVEAINHAKAGDAPIIVAVNKIDKPDANPERVMQQLSEHGLLPEAWGGSTIYCQVSALKREGIETLLENILLQSEMLELRANPDRRATGAIIEARLDPGRGPVATLLVENGTLRSGEAVVVGVYAGRIRAMMDEYGNEVESAGPGVPVEVLGISGVPAAGDRFYGVESDRDAKSLSLKLQQIQRQRDMRRTARVSLDTFFQEGEADEAKTLHLIVKGDVMGSVDAVSDALGRLSTEKVSVDVVHKGVGAISESDVLLASASDALIIGFKVRPAAGIDELARRESIEIRTYDIIYDATEEVRAAMLGLLEKKYSEEVLGRAEVRETFRVARVGTIAGCYVTDGKIVKGAPVRLLRDGVVTHDGTIGSLRRFKDDVREVTTGFECGIGLEGYNDIKTGDTLECYQRVEVEQTL